MDDRFINRELSWIAFNERVLDLATEAGIPLLERAKFCAIASTNLDEFFQVRVAALKDQVAAGSTSPRPTGARRDPTARATSPAPSRRWSPARTPCTSTRSARRSPRRASRSSHWSELDAEDRKALTEVYEQRIFPVLTPLAVDPSHPFPYISDLALSAGGDGSRPGDRRAALRPRQGARPPARGSCPCRRRALPAGRGAHHRPSRRPVRRHDHRGGARRSASPATPTSRSRKRRPTTCSRRSRWSCAAAGSTAPSASRSHDAISDEMLELLVRELDLHPNDVYRLRGTARPRVPLAAPGARPARPQGPRRGRRSRLGASPAGSRPSARSCR